jgi:hypothetical protein
MSSVHMLYLFHSFLIPNINAYPIVVFGFWKWTSSKWFGIDVLLPLDEVELTLFIKGKQLNVNTKIQENVFIAKW